MELLDFASQTERDEYERFVSGHELGGFTQSLKWCDIKKCWKHEVVVVRGKRREIVASMLVLIKEIPLLRTAFMYSPRGPVCDLHDKTAIAELMEGARLLAKIYRAYLFKCDPYLLASDIESIRVLNDSGLDHCPVVRENTVQCRSNYVLDIKDKTADEIFASFHSKWRYNIRLAERKGVECRICGKEALDDFYGLMTETGKRDGFCIRSKEYFAEMLSCLGENCRLYMCYFGGRPVSGAIATQYAGKTCYVYGASSDHAREAMPNYLMQWNMIRWAVENGDSLYDFQGVPFYYDESHPNYGVYRFKKGFNGRIVEYAGEFDCVFAPVRKKLIEFIYRAALSIK